MQMEPYTHIYYKYHVININNNSNTNNSNSNNSSKNNSKGINFNTTQSSIY